MRRFLGLVVITVWFVIGFASMANAQVEMIPPTPVPPGPPPGTSFTYPNVLVPPPHEKVFRFMGGAESGGAPVPTTFTVFFDWVEPGGTMFSPPITFTLLPFTTNPIDTMDFILPFCPELVSIHFVNGGPVPAFVTGSFIHECRPVPEPCSMLSIVVALLLATWGGIRRRLY
jgi:hypothetical protein